MVNLLEGGTIQPDEVRFLENCVWSTESAVRTGAMRLLERIDAPWAQEALENAALMG